MELWEELPRFVSEVSEIRALLAAEEAELNILRALAETAVNNARPTAFDEGAAEYWEELLCLPREPDLSIERRRERVRRRLLVGGSITPAEFTRIVRAAAGSEVEVSEDFANNTVTVTFTGIYGVCPYMADVMAEVERIRPLHITVNYVFIYAAWDNAAAFSWEELAKKSWQDVRLGKMLEEE